MMIKTAYDLQSWLLKALDESINEIDDIMAREGEVEDRDRVERDLIDETAPDWQLEIFYKYLEKNMLINAQQFFPNGHRVYFSFQTGGYNQRIEIYVATKDCGDKQAIYGEEYLLMDAILRAEMITDVEASEIICGGIQSFDWTLVDRWFASNPVLRKV
jgi:hypothetical protein